MCTTRTPYRVTGYRPRSEGCICRLDKGSKNGKDGTAAEPDDKDRNQQRGKRQGAGC